MLTDLDGTELERTARGARIVTALASGIGPVAGTLLPATPYLLEGSLLSMAEATLAAVALACVLLFAFGSYVGRVAGLNPYLAGARMGLAGLVVALVNYLLP
jgi:predicted membrane protein (TIGR00267 family)